MFYTFQEKTVKKYSDANAVSHAKTIAKNRNKEQRSNFGENASKELTMTLPELNSLVDRYINENFSYSGY